MVLGSGVARRWRDTMLGGGYAAVVAIGNGDATTAMLGSGNIVTVRAEAFWKQSVAWNENSGTWRREKRRRPVSKARMYSSVNRRILAGL
jgi:hypothetical protein